MLNRDVDFKHVPVDGGKQLAVFFGPMDRPPGSFSLFKRTEKYGWPRLFFNDVDHDFYSGKYNAMLELISDICEEFGYSDVIYYGYSAGAYVSLALGCRDAKCSRIFALSPQFRIFHDTTWGGKYHNPEKFEEDYRDIFDCVESNSNADIQIVMPVYEPADGVTVRELAEMQNPRISVSYVRYMHATEFFMAQDGVIDRVLDAFLGGEQINFPAEIVGDKNDVAISIASYDPNVCLHKGLPVTLPNLYDTASKNGGWHRLKAIELGQKGLLDLAIYYGVRSVTCNRLRDENSSELGDLFMDAELWWLAAASYKRAYELSKNPGVLIKLAHAQIQDWDLPAAMLTLEEARRRGRAANELSEALDHLKSNMHYRYTKDLPKPR